VDALPQERLFDYPAGEWRLVQKAKGYERIIVNGLTTFVDGECTQATPGRLLRHGAE
jgi:N-acyl-D-amino-acid deacylase